MNAHVGSRSWLARCLIGGLLAFACVGGSVCVASAKTIAPFNLTSDSRRLRAVSRKVLNDVRLRDTGTVMQSFAFNKAGTYMYVAQLRQQSSTVSYSTHSLRGDMTLSRIRMSDGVRVGAMRLKGFGHGMSIGVETSGTSDYVWTEASSSPSPQKLDAFEGRGTRIGVFRWKDGATIDGTAARLYDPPADAHTAQPECTPSIDQRGGRISINYRNVDDRLAVATYELAAYKLMEGRLAPINTIVLRPLGRDPERSLDASENPAAVIQGFVSRGDYLYTYWGNQTLPNTRIVSYQWSTNTTVQVAGSGIYSTYDHREPEGIAVRIENGVPKLCLGFGSRVGSIRRASFAYKTE